MQALGFFLPKSQMALILPNRFQLRTVENAKKNRRYTGLKLRLQGKTE